MSCIITEGNKCWLVLNFKVSEDVVKFYEEKSEFNKILLSFVLSLIFLRFNEMNLNFFKISVVCKFLILNCQIFFAAFGADALIENKDITYDGNLQNNEWLKNVYENIYPVINNTNSVTNVCDEESVNVEKSSWFFNVPLLPVIVATSNSIPEGLCKRQLQLYLNDLKNGTLWATESK